MALKLATVEVSCSGNKTDREKCKVRFPCYWCAAECDKFHFGHVLNVTSMSDGEGGVKRKE